MWLKTFATDTCCHLGWSYQKKLVQSKEKNIPRLMEAEFLLNPSKAGFHLFLPRDKSAKKHSATTAGTQTACWAFHWAAVSHSVTHNILLTWQGTENLEAVVSADLGKHSCTKYSLWLRRRVVFRSPQTRSATAKARLIYFIVSKGGDVHLTPGYYILVHISITVCMLV